MTQYTLGFLFNKNLSKVLLIHKLSPEWQKGKVNGLGGKFEQGEKNTECISREVKEETGLITKDSDWRKIGELHSSKFDVDVMAAIYEESEKDAQSIEKEQIEWFYVDKLPKNIMSNLSWLIPICIDTLVNKEINLFVTTHVF
jgi:8-oxo-dGTP diphosphatase